jgi:hypothetical protein
MSRIPRWQRAAEDRRQNGGLGLPKSWMPPSWLPTMALTVVLVVASGTFIWGEGVPRLLAAVTVVSAGGAVLLRAARRR